MNGYRERKIHEIEIDLVAAASRIAIWMMHTRATEFANISELSDCSEGLQAVLREYRAARQTQGGTQ